MRTYERHQNVRRGVNKRMRLGMTIQECRDSREVLSGVVASGWAHSGCGDTGSKRSTTQVLWRTRDAREVTRYRNRESDETVHTTSGKQT